MTYEEFKRELYRNILQQNGAEGKEVKLLERGRVCTEAQTLKIVKFINLSCRGSEDTMIYEDIIYATSNNETLRGMLYWQVRPMYERFKCEGWQGVLPEIAVKLQDMGEAADSIFKRSNAYGLENDRLILRPISYSRNASELENCIYWRFDDVALVLYALVYESAEDFMTMKIGRGMLEKGKPSGEAVLTNALLNTYAKMPPRLYHSTDLRCVHDPQEGVFMPGEEGTPIVIHTEDEAEGLRGYRVSTARGLNGAIAYFYPGVKERLAEILEGDYYVGFTSIHEAVVHPVRHKILGEMKEAIRHTNAVFGESEMLSDRVYRYISARKELVEV